MSQKSHLTLNSYGQIMLNNDIPVVKFKTSKYHSKSDEIRLGLGVT